MEAAKALAIANALFPAAGLERDVEVGNVIFRAASALVSAVTQPNDKAAVAEHAAEASVFAPDGTEDDGHSELAREDYELLFAKSQKGWNDETPVSPGDFEAP